MNHTLTYATIIGNMNHMSTYEAILHNINHISIILSINHIAQLEPSQAAFICSELTIETLDVIYIVQYDLIC